MRVTVTGDEAGDYIHALVAHVLEGFLHQLGGQVGVDHMSALLLLRADKVARVHADTVLQHGGHDVRRQSLAIRDNCVFGLLRQVVNQVYTVEDTLQLVEELVYIIK